LVVLMSFTPYSFTDTAPSKEQTLSNTNILTLVFLF
jgi:hypothetical protein